MNRLRLWTTLILLVAVIAGGLWLWWSVDLRWRPKTLTRDQPAIAAILQKAGWVSPHAGGAPVYLIAYAGCPDCAGLQTTELARLQADGADTRVIMIARPDRNGLAQSTPAERTTVAALWLNRDWGLFQRWIAAAPGAWTAPGLPPADGDVARTAVIGAGRASMADLAPLLRRNGVELSYPVMIWWTRAGAMRARAELKPPSYGAIERDLKG